MSTTTLLCRIAGGHRWDLRLTPTRRFRHCLRCDRWEEHTGSGAWRKVE